MRYGFLSLLRENSCPAKRGTFSCRNSRGMAGPKKKKKVGTSNKLVSRTERPKRMVPEERRYENDD
jgi:hypothetical protein